MDEIDEIDEITEDLIAKCPHCGKAAGVERTFAQPLIADCDFVFCANPQCNAILGTLIPRDLQNALEAMSEENQ